MMIRSTVSLTIAAGLLAAALPVASLAAGDCTDLRGAERLGCLFKMHKVEREEWKQQKEDWRDQLKNAKEEAKEEKKEMKEEKKEIKEEVKEEKKEVKAEVKEAKKAGDTEKVKDLRACIEAQRNFIKKTNDERKEWLKTHPLRVSANRVAFAAWLKKFQQDLRTMTQNLHNGTCTAMPSTGSRSSSSKSSMSFSKSSSSVTSTSSAATTSSSMTSSSRSSSSSTVSSGASSVTSSSVSSVSTSAASSVVSSAASSI